MNSGYSGWSMSRNAVAAYAGGEKPKSKWTKAAMLDAIDGHLGEFDLVATIDFSGLKKDELFERFFTKTSWHHTSKFCNETDFYGIDEDALLDASRPMTDGELAAREAARQAEREQAEAEEAARLQAAADRVTADRARKAEQDAWAAEHGVAWDSLDGYELRHPGSVRIWTSRRGRCCASIDDGPATVIPERDGFAAESLSAYPGMPQSLTTKVEEA